MLIFAPRDLRTSIGKSQPARSAWRAIGVMAALPALVHAQGVVISPATAPAVPAGSYCTSMYSELQGDLQAFNTVLATPPTWTPIPFPHRRLHDLRRQSAVGQ
jgi:hypothetical protein